MRTKVLVLSEKWKVGVARRSGEAYEMLTVRVVDKSEPKAARCKSILELTLAKEDNAYRDHLEDETLEVDILEIKGEFGGVVQGNARIVREASSAS